MHAFVISAVQQCDNKAASRINSGKPSGQMGRHVPERRNCSSFGFVCSLFFRVRVFPVVFFRVRVVLIDRI